MCGFERLLLQWINPTVISTNTSVTITDAITTSSYYRINITGSDEYFLLENRQKLSVYKKGDLWLQNDLPGTGLMIAHIRPSTALKRDRIHWEPADNSFLVTDNQLIHTNPATRFNSHLGQDPIPTVPMEIIQELQ